MKISIITLFPEVFSETLNSSILKRAQTKGKVEFELINLRKFGQGNHLTVDDKPFGGGVGMILKPDVLAKALQSVKIAKNIHPKIILTSASGCPYKQSIARRLAKLDHLIIVCGHYEGIDQRFIDKYIDEEVSIGDYVLTGGEVPGLVIIDTITRLIPGVLEKAEAVKFESFEDNLLEYPQYTRPQIFENIGVPAVLLSGNHSQIADWRRQQSLKKTKKVRPDLLE